MNQAFSYPPLVAASAVFALFVSFLPAGVGAAELRVPQDFPTIQAAITAAVSGDSVVAEPGTYQEAITLKDGVTVSGRETARTFLSGGGSGPIVTASGTVFAAISGFTFINTSIGIQVSDNPDILSITNNVFEVGAGGAAIVIQGSDLTEVVNNVFYRNGTAITRDADITIVNNIFSTNTTAIGGAAISPANETSNAFFGNITDGPQGSFPVTTNPLLVDPANHDFHLKAGSPCIDTGDATFGNDIIDGSLPDIGAYGGLFADPTPFPVAGLSITATTATSISLAWSPNNCYLVTDPVFPGTYSIRYGYASGVYDGIDADLGALPSPIDVLATEVDVLATNVGYTLTGLTPPSIALAAPVLDQPVPRNMQLALTWSAVPGAAGYKVHYGKISKGENTVDAGNTTAYTLSGLTNGQVYHVAVSAYAQSKYFFVITDFYGIDSVHESAFSPEVSAPIGATQDSVLSQERTEFPEGATPYPLLPNSHGACFIATAAYGDYSAPEVLALRAFRDQYLLINGPGRLFVQWYYRNGPAAAALLNAHPGFKPVVRAALLPAVGAAVFLTETSATAKAGLLLIIGSAIAIVFSRKRRSRAGGLR